MIASIEQSQSIRCTCDNCFICSGNENSTVCTLADGEAAATMLLAKQVQSFFVVNLDEGNTNNCADTVFSSGGDAAKHALRECQ